jgi:hypothetical protein
MTPSPNSLQKSSVKPPRTPKKLSKNPQETLIKPVKNLIDDYYLDSTT